MNKVEEAYKAFKELKESNLSVAKTLKQLKEIDDALTDEERKELRKLMKENTNDPNTT